MIPRPEEGSEDPLIEVRTEVETLCENPRKRSEEIPPALRVIEAKYKARFGHYAEFWLLLGVGHRIAVPLPIYGHYASSYYGRAELSDDIDEAAYRALLHRYTVYLIEQLELRSQRSKALMSDGMAKKYSLAAARMDDTLKTQNASASSKT